MAFDEFLPDNPSAMDNDAAKYELFRDISDQHEDNQADGDVPAAAPVSPCSSDGSSTAADGITGTFSSIACKYCVGTRVLGTGHRGSVRECTDRSTCGRYAVKSIRKGGHEVMPEILAREIVLLRQMNHRSIVRVVDVFEDENCVHLVTELCEGGELFDKIKERSSSSGGGAPCFAEDESARILYQVLDAVAYMHELDIVHRDMKPENVLFETTKEGSPVKIIDFGLARKHSKRRGDPPMTSFVGSPYYIAPEVLAGSYDRSCDIWSVGVISYTLLCGYPPFNGADNREVYDAVRRDRLYFLSEDWKHTSKGARKFIRRLLQRDTGRRMSAKQALRHPWIVKRAECVVSDENRLDDPSEQAVEQCV